MLLRPGLLHLPVAVTVGQGSTKSHQNGSPEFHAHYPLNPSCNSSPTSSRSSGSMTPNRMVPHLLFLLLSEHRARVPRQRHSHSLWFSGTLAVFPLVRVYPLGDQDVKLHDPEMRGWEAQNLSVIIGSNGMWGHLCFHTLVPGSMYSSYWGLPHTVPYWGLLPTGSYTGL